MITLPAIPNIKKEFSKSPNQYISAKITRPMAEITLKLL